jgi:transposase
MGSTSKGTRRRLPKELRDQAVRMVFELTEEQGEAYGIIPAVAAKLGISQRTLYRLVRQAEVDAGLREGTSRTEQARTAELERENRELRRANEILKAASTFFAAELDRHESR